MIDFRRLAPIAALAACVVSGAAFAQATGGPSASEVTPPQARRPPQQAAIDACKDRQEGERVRFVDAKGKSRRYPCVTQDGVMAARSGVATAAHVPKRK